MERSSAFGFNRLRGAVLPFPDATIAQGDRQSVLGSYAGILAGQIELFANAASAVMSIVRASALMDIRLNTAISMTLKRGQTVGGINE